METITINISRQDVYNEVEKATDYRGSKLNDSDNGARDRLYAEEEDLINLGRFWTEAAHSVNERLKSMLLSQNSETENYNATLEVSVAFDKTLTPSVEKSIRSYFIFFICGEWFRLAKKDESVENLAMAEEHLTNAERLLYSRKKPTAPTI